MSWRGMASAASHSSTWGSTSRSSRPRSDFRKSSCSDVKSMATSAGHRRGAVQSAGMDGEVAPGFENVRDVFGQFEADAGDGGYAYAAWHEGRKVVDLWTGSSGEGPWTSETTPLYMSVTKAITALCMQMLWDRGQLDVDAPVASYWPEFAAAG